MLAAQPDLLEAFSSGLFRKPKSSQNYHLNLKTLSSGLQVEVGLIISQFSFTAAFATSHQGLKIWMLTAN
jgi:hypothetical protein